MLFKFSINSCYSPRHVFGRGWAESEIARDGNVFSYWPDVSDVSQERFVTGQLKSHLTSFYS